MNLEFLIERFNENPAKTAVVFNGQEFSYQYLTDKFTEYSAEFAEHKVSGKVAFLKGDYHPDSIAALLALIRNDAIVAPLTAVVAEKETEYRGIACSQLVVSINDSGSLVIQNDANNGEHELYTLLRNSEEPGLVLFSSGSTGKPKGIVHNLVNLMEKYKTRRHDLTTITFLMFDHIGGIDTLFYCLSNASTMVTVQDRGPEPVCSAVEKYKVEVLPVSPTFLNLMLLSEMYEKYNLSSLKYITYGAEVMPEVTLKRCSELLPSVQFLQKFGTSEVGTLRSKSESNESLWVKLGGEGFQTRVVDDILQIKAKSAMLGYLNAPSPFTEDGWFITGDKVEVKGEYYRILGRETEVINVGGEKVNPSEVENVIQELPNVAEVLVYGEKNPIMGNIVCAKVRLFTPVEDQRAFTNEIKRICKEKLQPYKIPVKVSYSTEELFNTRFKKIRKPAGE